MKTNEKGKQRFWLGILVIALVLGITACSDGGGGSNNNNASLNGTWLDEDILGDFLLKFNNGNWELLFEGILARKGTYNTKDNKLTLTLTHLRDYYDSKLYTKAEYIALLAKEDAELAEEAAELLTPLTATYSINGNILTLSFDEDDDKESYWGLSDTYIRK